MAPDGLWSEKCTFGSALGEGRDDNVSACRTTDSRTFRNEEATGGEGNDVMRVVLWNPEVERDTTRTNTSTVPSPAPLPFLSGNSIPVPPEACKETSVGIGQLPAVSSVISNICPSIGCRCQFRPNRCMAAVSNEKSQLWGGGDLPSPSRIVKCQKQKQKKPQG